MTATSASTSPSPVETRTPSSPQSMRWTGELQAAPPRRARSASASGRRWLPPAMLGAGSSSMCATPVRSAAATRSARVRARDLDASEDRLARARRDVERVEEVASALPLGRRRQALARPSATAAAQLLVGRADAAARVAPAVAHALVPEPEPEPVDELPDRRVARAGRTRRPSRRPRHSGARATTPARRPATAPRARRPRRRRAPARRRQPAPRARRRRRRPSRQRRERGRHRVHGDAHPARGRARDSARAARDPGREGAHRPRRRAARRRERRARLRRGRREHRRCAQPEDRFLDALGRCGKGHDRGVAEELGPCSAGGEHETGHDGVGARRDEQLGAGARHPLDEDTRLLDLERDEPAVGGRGSPSSVATSSRSAPMSALCCNEGALSFTAT